MSAKTPELLQDQQYGRAAPALGWVPAPRFLLRRDLVLRTLGNQPSGRVLEIGCGAGTLLADLCARGFSCTAVETSPTARALASRLLMDLPHVTILETLPAQLAEPVDLLMAFEVLEHIEHDVEALTNWCRHVKPGGRVLLSMPAHAHRWTARDTWVGHVRRYDRKNMIALAEECGLGVRQVVNYGFPLANAIERFGDWRYAKELRRLEREASNSTEETANAAFRDERTSLSGIARSAESRLYPVLTSWPGRLVMRGACQTQRWFADTALGNGFLLDAIKG